MTPPPLMAHAARRRLIEAPFPQSRVIPRRLWAGVHIPHEEDDPTHAYGGGVFATQWSATLAEALVDLDPALPLTEDE